jgi:glycosyltransferase involved in cell wall biosynthesis
LNILFLSISTAISNIANRGIYPDLLRYFANHGHEVFIVCPYERRTKRESSLQHINNIHILGVKTLNITKTSIVEKGLATFLIERQFGKAINKNFNDYKFDLILYSTPPITFNLLIEKLKFKHQAKTYLMLKDIFPQNAIDLGIIKEGGILSRYFRKKEQKLYKISDFIGCMSPANVEYTLEKNIFLDRKKIGICPNAIEVIDRVIVNKQNILNSYRIPSDTTVFIYGGNLGVPQGIELLIKILEIYKNRIDCFFVIVGNGEKAHLVEKWVRLNSPINIIYLPELEKNKYEQLEACCDIGMIFLDKRFTIPNFPSRMLSYLECKLPLLIVTDLISDLGLIATNNKFGKYSIAGDLFSISENIEFFINNSEQRRIMGENGFKYLIDNYNVSIAYNAIINSLKI